MGRPCISTGTKGKTKYCKTCRFSPRDCLKGLEVQRRGKHQGDVLTRALLTWPSSFSRKSWFSPWVPEATCLVPHRLPCTSQVVQGSELLVHPRVSSVFFSAFLYSSPFYLICLYKYVFTMRQKKKGGYGGLVAAVKSAVPQGALG